MSVSSRGIQHTTSAPLVIALDGPAGVGKSTVAIAVADALGLAYVETGALYRAVALLARRAGLDFDQHVELAKLAADMGVQFAMVDGVNRVVVDGEDLTEALRAPDMGPAASTVSAIAEVRAALMELQRRFGREGMGAVAEGRDIGTVVFPNATYKFFLTADVEERVRRRVEQLVQKGKSVDPAHVRQEVEARDSADSGRKVAPLKPADDAIILDSTSMNAQQVIRAILTTVRGTHE